MTARKWTHLVWRLLYGFDGCEWLYERCKKVDSLVMP